MKKIVTIGLVGILIVWVGMASGVGIRHCIPGKGPLRIFAIDNTTHLDANLIDMFVTNHGSFAYDWTTGNPGLTYPKGTDKQAVFAAGLWMGAKVNGETRVTVAEYSTEYQPGPMDGTGPNSNSSDPGYRVYKIDPNSGPGDADWDEWPVSQGAPVDANGDPLLIGDQTLWCVYNDAEPSDHTNQAGATLPLGIEVQQTAFAYNRTGALGNICFIKFLIINKGENVLDSSYVAVWSDPDLGGAGDDLVGCDTTLSVGYCYNATNNDNVYGTTPPCVGYDFFQGPIVPGGESDTAYVSGVAYPGFRNLPMTAFNRYINGTDPQSPTQSYWYLMGLQARGVTPAPQPYVNPATGDTSTYPYCGDPVTNTGWLDDNASDRRLLLSSGPFLLEPTSMHGDSVIIGVTAQEVVAAVIMGQGTDRLNSITVMKSNDNAAQGVFDANFNIPNPPPRPSVYFQARDGYINLIWGTEADGNVQINEDLDQEFDFEGFNVYQGESVAGPWHRIATFDEENDYTYVDPVSGDTLTAPLTLIYMDIFDAQAGGMVRQIVQHGNNTGLVHNLVINGDAVNGGSLVNFHPYYFAVTAYNFEIRHATPYLLGPNVMGWISETLENAPNAIQCIPGSQGLQDSVTATHVSGLSDGMVTIHYIPEYQDSVTGHQYEVTFDTTGGSVTWSLRDMNENAFVLTGQTNQSGDWAYPIVDGIMVRVMGPQAGVKSITEIAGAGGVPIDPPDNVMYSLNSTGDWYVSPPSMGWGGLNYQGLIGIDNWEFRFTIPDSGSNYYDWNTDGLWRDTTTNVPLRAPFQIWNVGPTAESPQHRCQFASLDDADPWAWSYGDRMYISEQNYVEPLPDPMEYTFPDDFHLGRVIFADYSGATTAPAPGTVVLFETNKPNAIDDVFRFQTRLPWTGLSWDLNKVKVVPNPYYGHSSYELNPYDKVLKFINLPRNVTIRIFNLGGDHIKTLTKNNSSTELIWNLETKYNIPVASGIYIWYLDAPGIGTKEGKTAVFMERETLNTF
jgi:hypothetical protein